MLLVMFTLTMSDLSLDSVSQCLFLLHKEPENKGKGKGKETVTVTVTVTVTNHGGNKRNIKQQNSISIYY